MKIVYSSKQEMKKHAIIVLLGGVICLLQWVTSDILLQVILLSILYLYSIILVKFDLLHPYFWFGLFYVLYSISFPIISVLGGGYENIFVTSDLLAIETVGFFIFLICISPERNDNKINFDIVISRQAINFFINILSIISMIAIFFILKNGFSSKGEIYESGNILYSFVFSIIYLVLTFYCIEYSIKRKCYKRANLFSIVRTGSICLLLTIFSGERDIFFQFILSTVFLAFFWRDITRKSLIIFFPIGILSIPISAIYKYYFLTGNTVGLDETFNSVSGFINMFFNGEFIASSRNLQIMINNAEISSGIMLGKTFISDVLRIFGFSPWSGQEWFNSTFFSFSTIGHGFTLLGEGYLNFGFIGIIIEMIVVSIFLNYLYRKSTKSIYWLTIYITSIPLFIYANRADLSNILAPFIRHVVFSCLIVYLATSLLTKGKNRMG